MENYTDGMTSKQWADWFMELSPVNQQVCMVLVDALIDMGLSVKDSCLIVYEGYVMAEAGMGQKH